MHDICTYYIEVRGQVDESDLNATSPHQAVVVRASGEEDSPAVTLCTLHADQAGLIGLMRYLHGRGFVLLSVQREQSTPKVVGAVPDSD